MPASAQEAVLCEGLKTVPSMVVQFSLWITSSGVA